jgi:hypothetical protein
MKKLIILLMILPVLAIAADRDMDGVRDDHDACRNTPFWAVVNSKGCTVKHIRPRKK